MDLLDKLKDRLSYTTLLERQGDNWNYVIVYHDGPRLLTWHSPVCSYCREQGVAHRHGWDFSFQWRDRLGDLVASGLGFELTWCRNEDPTV